MWPTVTPQLGLQRCVELPFRRSCKRRCTHPALRLLFCRQPAAQPAPSRPTYQHRARQCSCGFSAMQRVSEGDARPHGWYSGLRKSAWDHIAYVNGQCVGGHAATEPQGRSAATPVAMRHDMVHPPTPGCAWRTRWSAASASRPARSSGSTSWRSTTTPPTTPTRRWPRCPSWPNDLFASTRPYLLQWLPPMMLTALTLQHSCVCTVEPMQTQLARLCRKVTACKDIYHLPSLLRMGGRGKWYGVVMGLRFPT